MTPTSRPGLGRSANLRPEMVTLPEVGEVRPTIIRIEVDFPAPFGPRKPVTRPVGAAKLMSSTTVLAPYFLDRESMVIMDECPLVSLPAVGGSWRCSLVWWTGSLNARNVAASARRHEVALESDQPMRCESS